LVEEENEVVDLLKFSLATFGITYIIRYTDGPFDIIAVFRVWMGIKKVHTGIDEFFEDISDGFFAKLFSCFWCVSTWVSLLLILIFNGFDFVLWFACIGFSGFMHEIIVRHDG